MKRMASFFLIFLFYSCSLTRVESRSPAGKKSFKEKFVDNIKNPHFWGPLAAASVIHIGGQDEKISDWAYENKPVYGTRERAMLRSDEFNKALEYQMYASIFLMPYQATSASLGQFAIGKAFTGAVAYLAFKQTRDVTYQAKTSAGRERPNRVDTLSFPSGHSSAAGAARNVASRNYEKIQMHSGLRTGLSAMNTTLAIGTLWARVESKWHYPVDTLVGYSLGQFVSSFIYDALIDFNPNQTFAFWLNPDGASATYGIKF